jgi:hypothetical protein
MASTYRSPETVVVSEAAPIVDAINSLSSTFLKTAGNIKAIKDKKVKQAQEFNQRLIKDISIDPTSFYKALGESNANRALFDQVNNLMDENAKLQLDIEAGLYSQSDYRGLMASKNKTIAELSQLVGLAESEKTSSASWVENAEDRVNNLTNQGGDSLVGNTEYINAKNIFSKMSKGSVERVFKDNVMYYKIQGDGLDKPYEIPATGFLSKQLFKVPNFDKEYKNMLIQKGILTSTGAKTEYFKNMSADEFERDIGEIIDAKVLGAIKDRRVANSMFIEIFGGEGDPFKQYGGGDEKHIAGSTISNADAERLREAMFKYAMNITPAWKAKAPKDPKPLPRWMRDAKDLKGQKTAWQDRLEQRVTTLGLGINKEGEVFTGTIKPLDAEGNIRPEFEKALSGIGYSIEKKINQDVDSDDPKAIAVDVYMSGISGRPVRIFQDQLAQDFIYNLGLYTFGDKQMDWAGKYSGKFKGQKFN